MITKSDVNTVVISLIVGFIHLTWGVIIPIGAVIFLIMAIAAYLHTRTMRTDLAGYLRERDEARSNALWAIVITSLFLIVRIYWALPDTRPAQ